MREYNILFNKKTSVISFARSNRQERASQNVNSPEQRYNNRTLVIFRNNTNVTLIIEGDDYEIYLH